MSSGARTCLKVSVFEYLVAIRYTNTYGVYAPWGRTSTCLNYMGSQDMATRDRYRDGPITSSIQGDAATSTGMKSTNRVCVAIIRMLGSVGTITSDKTMIGIGDDIP